MLHLHDMYDLAQMHSSPESSDNGQMLTLGQDRLCLLCPEGTLHCVTRQKGAVSGAPGPYLGSVGQVVLSNRLQVIPAKQRTYQHTGGMVTRTDSLCHTSMCSKSQ